MCTPVRLHTRSATHKAAHPFSCTPVASLESSCRRQVLHSLELEYPDEPQVRSLTELLFLTEKKKDREYLLGNTLGRFLTFKIGQLLLSLFFFFYWSSYSIPSSKVTHRLSRLVTRITKQRDSWVQVGGNFVRVLKTALTTSRVFRPLFEPPCSSVCASFRASFEFDRVY